MPSRRVPTGSGYNNPEFDKLLTQAAAAKTTEEANALYQQAEALLEKDFPTAPLWSSKTTSAGRRR